MTSSSEKLTPFAVAGAASALGWFGLGAESVVRPEPADFRDALVLVPWTLLTVTLLGVHMAQRDRTGRGGLAGLALIVAGAAVAITGNVGLVLGTEALTFLSFPVGPLVFCAGLVVFGAATWRAGVFPRWTAVLIATSQVMTTTLGVALSIWVPVSAHGSYTGGLWHGMTMLAVAVRLRRLPSVTA
ncbi:hypothetical protein [Herbidospora sp. NBRC 101105]|uniref:hypothetical protein n=1 Tax=Herbidospora sp. NBRC 101105 TaxID=3032195 RepID=UPI0024A13CB7|nr:hypothetical protein [Herbidospora sp. NBRC 101105]GLX94479.1 hypothetical protein Hesp01_24290 [Herbidospora sp. NBRC 101105]